MLRLINTSKTASLPQQGIDPYLKADLLELGRPVGLKEIHEIPASKIELARWVHLKCRYGCQNYNTNWCCPPATPSQPEFQAILIEYRRALLLIGNGSHTHFYRNDAEKRGRQVKIWKTVVSIERMLLAQGYRKVLGLAGECCALCRNCAYPDPCRFPEERRPSIEACSIDILGTLNNLGLKFHLARQKTENYNHYSLVLLD